MARSTADRSSSRYVGRSRAYSPLAATVKDFKELGIKRMNAIMKASVSDVIDNAQTPVGKGGRMRVDTGFLRASGQASLTGMPTGPVRGDKTEKFAYDNGSRDGSTFVSLTINKLQAGNTFHFGWTANYARYRELYDGFLEGAMQHWARIVAINADTVRQRIK